MRRRRAMPDAEHAHDRFVPGDKPNLAELIGCKLGRRIRGQDQFR